VPLVDWLVVDRYFEKQALNPVDLALADLEEYMGSY